MDIMEEMIEEFLKQEDVSDSHNINVWSESKKKWLSINVIDFIDKYNKFLRKNSFLK